jgi:methyltransferase
MIWYALLIAVVAVERIAELVVSQRNLSWSRTRGGVNLLDE